MSDEDTQDLICNRHAKTLDRADLNHLSGIPIKSATRFPGNRVNAESETRR